MSDVMFFGVLRMPYEMAMSGELSRRQFYSRAREAADRVEELEAEVARLRAAQSNSASESSSNCVACEGSPSGDNNPCAVCGRAAPAAGTVEKDAAYDILKLIIEDGYLSDTNTARGHAAIEAHTRSSKEQACGS